MQVLNYDILEMEPTYTFHVVLWPTMDTLLLTEVNEVYSCQKKFIHKWIHN